MPYPNAPSTNAIASEIQTFQQGMPSALLTFCTTPITASGSPQPFTPTSMTGISVGMTLNVDVTAQEFITVSSITAGMPSAIFTKNHSNTWTIGTGSLTYTLVKIGAVLDPTDVLTYCAITFEQGVTKPFAGSGWRVDDRPTFMLESGFDMTDATAAEQSVMTVRDVVIPIYTAQISLASTPGVYLTILHGTPDKAMYKSYPSGRIYRIHQVHLTAVQQYNVTVSGP